MYTYQTAMPCVGFKPTIPASERAKTILAYSDRRLNFNGIYTVITLRTETFITTVARTSNPAYIFFSYNIVTYPGFA
jgi:hypothetical protein